MKKEPKYVVYYTYLNREIFLNVIRWSDKFFLELYYMNPIIRKRLTKNIIGKLEELSSVGFMDPAEISWLDTYTGYNLYISANLGNLKRILSKLDLGKVINLYHVY